MERFLAETDPDLVTLCLDTGHIAYCEGDNLKLIQDYPERIGYVHLKQVDPQVMAKVRAEEIGFGEAVKLGAMCEPPQGEPPMAPILDALAALDHVELFAIVEQDLYPCEPDTPLPIATRTLDYLHGLRTARLTPKGTTMSQTSEPIRRAAPCGRDRRRDDGRRPCRAARQPGRQRHPRGGRRTPTGHVPTSWPHGSPTCRCSVTRST